MKAICGRGRTLLRRSGALSAAVAVGALCVLALAGPASAAGAGAVSFTHNFHNEVILSDHLANPCTGAPGTVTFTAKNGVFHITTLANGTSWATFTAEGTVTFVPDNPADASASGHFAVWDGENVNLRNGTATSTSNSVLSGSDGSRIGVHEVFHMNVSATGIGGISFDKPVLTCG